VQTFYDVPLHEKSFSDKDVEEPDFEEEQYIPVALAKKHISIVSCVDCLDREVDVKNEGELQKYIWENWARLQETWSLELREI